MVTAKFQRNGQPAKYIPNASTYKGYLVSFTGNKKKPYFDSEKMTAAQKEQIQKRNYTDVEDVIKDGLESMLLVWGKHETYTLLDVEQANRLAADALEQKILNKETPIEVQSRDFGYYLMQQVPASIFSLIKPFGRYWSANDMDEFNDDVDDFHKVGQGKYNKGWYFQNGIIDVLKKAGYEVVVK